MHSFMEIWQRKSDKSDWVEKAKKMMIKKISQSQRTKNRYLLTRMKEKNNVCTVCITQKKNSKTILDVIFTSSFRQNKNYFWHFIKKSKTIWVPKDNWHNCMYIRYFNPFWETMTSIDIETLRSEVCPNLIWCMYF